MKNVVEISIKTSMTKKREQMISYYFSKGEVSFFSDEVRLKVMDREVQGICMKRFKGDIVTKGMDYSKIEVGDIVTIGELKIVVTQVGKACHTSDCEAYNEQVKCIMQSGVLFGEVKASGKVSLGDLIS